MYNSEILSLKMKQIWAEKRDALRINKKLALCTYVLLFRDVLLVESYQIGEEFIESLHSPGLFAERTYTGECQ